MLYICHIHIYNVIVYHECVHWLFPDYFQDPLIKRFKIPILKISFLIYNHLNSERTSLVYKFLKNQTLEIPVSDSSLMSA